MADIRKPACKRFGNLVITVPLPLSGRADEVIE
jgi:hypothetical protein